MLGHTIHLFTERVVIIEPADMMKHLKCNVLVPTYEAHNPDFYHII